MASSFKGWLNSWGGSWGPVTFDPNAMAGAAGFTFTATATLTQQPTGELSGVASMTFSAMGVLTALVLGAPAELVGGYAKSHVNYKNAAADDEAAKNYVDRLNAEFERKSRLQRDDMLATEFIMAVLQSEILHG